MTPLTRMRADDGGIPNNLIDKYYAQRATTGGLIIAEATLVSTNGQTYEGMPGIDDQVQVKSWKKIIDAIHAKGTKAFLQLWYSGR